MYKVSDMISVSAASMAEAENKFKITGIVPKKQNEKQGIEVSYEQRMIEQFHEQNSPEKKKVQQIYGKFRAGVELTADELQYLANHNPDLYHEVCEIMQERKAMELRMKQAKTKQEVSAVCLNEMTCVKGRMGTGKQAKANAEKTMAAVNQFSHAYIKYTATAEYKNKEDARTQAEDMKAKLEKLQAIIAEQQENVAEAVENTAYEEVKTVLGETQAAQDTKQLDKTSEGSKEVAEDIKEQERRRRKRKSRGQQSAETEEAVQLEQMKMPQVDYTMLLQKIKKL